MKNMKIQKNYNFLREHLFLHRLHLHFIFMHFVQLLHLHGRDLHILHKGTRLVDLLLRLFRRLLFPPLYTCGKLETSFKCLGNGSSIIMYIYYHT